MKRFIVSLILMGVFITAGSWGFLMHKTAHQLAIYELPKKLQRFFYKNIDSLEYNSVRPDVRRNTDSTEDAKHFIDLEFYGDSAAWKMPVHWDEAVKQYSKDTLLKYGYVPYHVVFMQQLLANAFKHKNADSILFYAADLGHYIEDANVPLHTTLNYDGQLTGQKGLHSLWETTVPEIEISSYNLKTKHKATYISNKEEAIWNAIRKAHLLLPAIFEKEKEVSAQFTDSTKYRIQIRKGSPYKTFSSEFAKAYSAALGNSINEQLINSANLAADFWYTAWADAGKPDLSNLSKSSFIKADRKKLRKELKSFKHNTLIENGMLRSKQKSGK